MTDTTIHVLCASDAKYGPYTGIMISSILYSNPNEIFHFHYMSDGLRHGDIARIRRIALQAGSEATIYDVRRDIDEHARVMTQASYVSRATYARFFVDRYLPANLDSILYVDSDMVCRGSLRPLWDMRSEVELFMAIPNMAPADVLAEYKTRLGMPEASTYYNSGVMLTNLSAWRQTKATQRALEYLWKNREKIRISEQDTLNGAMWNEIKPLPGRWNLQLGAMQTMLAEEKILSSTLIHYAGTYKPWQLGYRGAGASLFRKAKATSPWRLTLPESRMFSRLKKSLHKKFSIVNKPVTA